MLYSSLLYLIRPDTVFVCTVHCSLMLYSTVRVGVYVFVHACIRACVCVCDWNPTCCCIPLCAALYSSAVYSEGLTAAAEVSLARDRGYIHSE